MNNNGKVSLEPLKRVRVVLVEPKFSGNLGFSARVMKNLGFSELYLVRPKAELNKEAYSRAISATEILDQAKIFSALADAISDCVLVFGTSRKKGRRRKNVISPERMIEIARPIIEKNEIALVFGSEETGISNEDLKLCHFIVKIETGTEYDSLNLSHAIAILLYEFNRSLKLKPAHTKKLATTRELEGMYEHIQEMLVKVGFIRQNNKDAMMGSIRRILNRSLLDSNEVKVLRGICRQVMWATGHSEAHKPFEINN